MRVDLPDPLGPMIAMKLAAGMVMETSDKAVRERSPIR